MLQYNNLQPPIPDTDLNITTLSFQVNYRIIKDHIISHRPNLPSLIAAALALHPFPKPL